MLTVKSDDVVGRVKTYEAIVKGQQLPEPGIPESFRVLVKELQALALDVRLLDNDGEEVHMSNIEDEERRFPRSFDNEKKPEEGKEDSAAEGTESEETFEDNSMLYDEEGITDENLENEAFADEEEE